MFMGRIACNLGAIAFCAASFAWSGPANPVAPAVSAASASTLVSTLALSPAPLPAKSPSVAKAKPKVAQAAPAQRNTQVSGTLQGTVDPSALPKPALADAFIAQTVLRVYLNRPASVSVYNSRGQQVFHVESQRTLETVPLLGVNTGFVYLTVRTAQGETTRKLVFTGK
jgi:hypothetical protein